MAEFVDGLRDPDYEGLSDAYPELDMLEPDSAFDPEVEVEWWPNRRIRPLVTSDRVKELRQQSEEEDPLNAALGHLGLASEISKDRRIAAIILEREHLPVPASLIAAYINSSEHTGTAGEVGMWYELVHKALRSNRFDQEKGSLSSFLGRNIRSGLARESYKQLVVTSSDYQALGLVMVALAHHYEHGLLDEDQPTQTQSSSFDYNSSRGGEDYDFPKLTPGRIADDDRVTRLAELRNLVFSPLGEELSGVYDEADQSMLTLTEDLERKLDIEQAACQILDTANLSKYQRDLLDVYYGLRGIKPMTVKEIASARGVTTQAVSQAIAKVLAKLRKAATKDFNGNLVQELLGPPLENEDK